MCDLQYMRVASFPTQMKFHHNLMTASQWVQPHCLYHHVHMVPGHAFPATVCILLPLLGRNVLTVIIWLLILSGDIETNPGPAGESSGSV